MHFGSRNPSILWTEKFQSEIPGLVRCFRLNTVKNQESSADNMYEIMVEKPEFLPPDIAVAISWNPSPIWCLVLECKS